MDPMMINRSLKAKKLEKFLECFPNEKPYEMLRKLIDVETAQDKNAEEEIIVPKNGEILICGYPALYGTVLLTQLYEEELAGYFPGHFILQTLEWKEKAEQYKASLEEVAKQLKAKGAYVYPLGEGGLNKAMYQLGKDSGIGFTIFHEDIPVRQESIEVCEFFDLDPWSLFSAGSMLIVSERSRELAEEIKAMEIPVARAGYMTSGKDKFISHKTINSRVNRPAPDGLLKVLQSKLTSVEDTEGQKETGEES